jgi:tetratricopeptide (TPR) repeat protein
MPKRPNMQRRGSSPGSMPAGSVAAGTGRILAEAVERHRRGLLDEATALYKRVLAMRPNQPDALHLLGRIADAKGEPVSALALIDRAIAADGYTAAFHVSRGSVLLSLGRADEAKHALQQALRLDPNSAEAHNTLGNALVRSGERNAAVECYRRALAIRPQYAEAHNNLGSALRALGRLDEGETELRYAIELRPGYASALANLGLVLQEQARYGEALEAYDKAIAADPAHPAARGNRAMLLLLLGRLREGFAEYEWRWHMPGFARPHREFPQPMWGGDALAGRTLFVQAEQGLGSAIQFVRYVGLAAAKGGRLILECQRPLQRLFAHSLARPGRPAAGVVVKGEELPRFDCHAPLMSLPHLLGTTLDTIPGEAPYLTAPPDDVAAWRGRLAGAPRPRVGLVWAGNANHENDHNRSMSPRLLAPLVANTRVPFFSLQVPAAPDAVAAFPAGSVSDLAPGLGDFAVTAAVIANLDLVISVDTAVAHLAGALGRPVWLLLPYVPEWRWLLDREDSPWYPTMRLFRQGKAGDWESLVERVTEVLFAWCSERGTAR